MKLKSVEEIPSSVIKGLNYKLVRLTDRARTSIKIENAAQYDRLDVLQDERKPLQELKSNGEVPSEVTERLSAIDVEIQDIFSTIDAAYMKACVKEIDLEIDDIPVTLENVKELAPIAIYDELQVLVQQFSVLSRIEAKN